MTQNDSKRNEMCFSHSPSPSLSMLSSSSLTSRLSQEEIDSILSSPYDTGYTYSQSAAYRRYGSTEFRHPQLCRQFKTSSAPSFLKNFNSSSSVTLTELTKKKLSKIKSNVFFRFWYYALFLLKTIIVLSVTLIVFTSKKVYKTGWSLVKWLAYYFILTPILTPYYTALQYYNYAIFAVKSSNHILVFLKRFREFVYKQTINVYQYLRSINVKTYSNVKQTNKLSKISLIAKSFFAWSVWFFSFGIVKVGLHVNSFKTPHSLVLRSAEVKNTKNQNHKRINKHEKHNKIENCNILTYILYTTIYIPTLGLYNFLKTSFEEQEFYRPEKGVCTRAQSKNFAMKRNATKRFFEEDKNVNTKKKRENFFVLQWFLMQIFWPFTVVYCFFTNRLFLSSDNESSFSSPQFTSTPTISAGFLEVRKRVNEKQARAAATSISLWEKIRFVCVFLGLLVLRLALLFALLFLLYLMVTQKTEIGFSNSSAELLELKNEIIQLKLDLSNTIVQADFRRLNQLQVSEVVDENFNLEANLNTKVTVILDRLMSSSNEARFLEMREFEKRVLENARQEIKTTVSEFQASLRNSADATINFDQPINKKSLTKQSALNFANLTLEKLKIEVDEKIASFVKLMNNRESEQHTKLLSELDQLRSTMLKDRSQFMKSYHEKNTLIPSKSYELEDSLYLQKIHKLIKEYIHRYDADKTGLPDYALESSGGSIVSIRCTVSYNERSRMQMVFGIPLWYSSYSPRSVIQRKGHGASAGECWAFVGSHGYLVIKLSNRINVTAISYEHLPVQLSPEGHIQTAPRDFLVYSYQNVDDLKSRFLLGNFTYDDKGEPLQTFNIENYDPRQTPLIEFEMMSNYGSMVTCLYRFRVHGHLLPPKTFDNSESNNAV